MARRRIKVNMPHINKFFFISITLYYLFNITIVNSMILDEQYSDNGKETLLEIINKDIITANALSLLAIQDLKNTSNINKQITQLRILLNQALINNIMTAAESIKSSNIENSLKSSMENFNYLINSIYDKTDMILGGTSPIGMAFFSEEIVKQFIQINIGIDKNNNNIIENQLGEGCLNYINLWNTNTK